MTITFEEEFMEAMRTYNSRIAPKVHVLVHHVPEYVRRTGVQLGSTSEQALASQHTFVDIFYHKFKVNCTNSPVSRERLLKYVLHNNSCYLLIADWHFGFVLPDFTFLGQLGVYK